MIFKADRSEVLHNHRGNGESVGCARAGQGASNIMLFCECEEKTSPTRTNLYSYVYVCAFHFSGLNDFVSRSQVSPATENSSEQQ